MLVRRLFVYRLYHLDMRLCDSARHRCLNRRDPNTGAVRAKIQESVKERNRGISK